MANEMMIVRGKMTGTSLTLPPGITEEEWLEVGEQLGKFERSKMWWVGDWLRHKYPDGYVERGEYEALEEKTGLGKGTMKNALCVSKAINSSIRIDELSFLHHQFVAPLPEKEQQEWLAWAVAGKKSCRELREAIRNSKTPELPSDKYRVLYADPPWEYGNAQHGLEEQETVLESHYPTMSDEALSALDVGDIAMDDAVLFLWATAPRIEFAITLAQTWGFEYKAMFVWDKVKHNVGYYNSVRHELLLICTRGDCLPDNRELFDSVQSIERTQHSEKPEQFREIINVLYPRGKRIELFARKTIEGWDRWGN